MHVEVLASGHVTRDDAAFPTLAVLGDGSILCAYTAKGDGPNAIGGTDLSRSTDGGYTWEYRGTILPRVEEPVAVNSLRISRSGRGRLYAYGERTYLTGAGQVRDFRNDVREPVFCTSDDDGRSWSSPVVIPTSLAKGYEISNPMLCMEGNRLLAPAALLPDEEHLGEKVVLFESEDGGKTWPGHIEMLADPEGKKGFFEQKVIALGGGRLLAAAWTVILGEYSDLENHFAWSSDSGKSWSVPRPMGVRGQTLTPHFLGNDADGACRLLCLSNRRYGDQGVVAYLVTASETDSRVEFETMVWDAKMSRNRSTEKRSGIEAFDDFAFGLPSALSLGDDNYLAVHWCREAGVFGIRWTRMRIA